MVLRSHRPDPGPLAAAVSLAGRRASVTWQLPAPANPRRPHQPPRVAQPEGAELRRWRLRRQRWRRRRRRRQLWRPQSRTWLRPQPHHGDARGAAGARGRPPGHGLGLLRQHRRARRGVLLRAGHLGHQDGPHLRGGRGRLPGHRRGGAGALPAAEAGARGRSGVGGGRGARGACGGHGRGVGMEAAVRALGEAGPPRRPRRLGPWPRRPARFRVPGGPRDPAPLLRPWRWVDSLDGGPPGDLSPGFAARPPRGGGRFPAAAQRRQDAVRGAAAFRPDTDSRGHAAWELWGKQIGSYRGTPGGRSRGGSSFLSPESTCVSDPL